MVPHANRVSPMARVRVQRFADWRSAARSLLAQEVSPHHVDFIDGRDPQHRLELAADAAAPNSPPPAAVSEARSHVPRRFMELAARVACHRDPRRWNLLYRLLWRITHGESALLDAEPDDDLALARRFEAQVRRDERRMKDSVRFRACVRAGQRWYVGWYRPEHYIVSRVAPFFVERFSTMRWMILTPSESVSWDMSELRLLPGATRAGAPLSDDLAQPPAPATAATSLILPPLDVSNWSSHA